MLDGGPECGIVVVHDDVHSESKRQSKKNEGQGSNTRVRVLQKTTTVEWRARGRNRNKMSRKAVCILSGKSIEKFRVHVPVLSLTRGEKGARC